MRPLLGMYELALEEDGVIVLPPKYAATLGQRLFGWVTPDRAVRIVTRESVDEALLEKIRAAGASNAEIEADRYGQMTVPAPLCEGADVRSGDICILIGLGTSIELWNRDRYAVYLDSNGRI